MVTWMENLLKYIDNDYDVVVLGRVRLSGIVMRAI